MTWEIAVMLLLLLATLIAFTLEKLPTELVAMIAYSTLLILGFIPAHEAMRVFSNPGPIAVGALFVLSAALERAGAIDAVGVAVNRLPRLSLRVVMPLMILVVALISAFINNTPVVVVFLPIVIGLARQMDIAPSKLLIPLSFASIFGGTCTLVGTSTNIVVSSVAENAGLAPFSMFELALVGLPILVFGTVYLTLFGPKLLPVRETLSSILTEEERREYIVEAYVTQDSALDGRTIGATLSRQKGKFRVIEILRNGVKIEGGLEEIVMQSGDRLLLALSPKAVSSTQQTGGLDFSGSIAEGLMQISQSEGLIVEGVLGPDSSLVGKSIDEINFRQRYRLAPIALHRRSENMSGDFKSLPLEYGDTLLLLGTTDALDALYGNEDILIINKPPVALAGRRKQLFTTLAVVVGVILSATLGLLPIASSAIVGCVVLITLRCITTHQAYEAVHWPILFLIFAMLGFGAAMEHTGTSKWLADGLVALISGTVTPAWQPVAMLAGIYLITTILTEILSNNAAAILLSALAISIAETLNIDSRPFLIAIAVAASASFATPIGYQTNTYVYGIGGYRFVDFLKVGVPLNILSFIVTVIVVPLVWEF